MKTLSLFLLLIVFSSSVFADTKLWDKVDHRYYSETMEICHNNMTIGRSVWDDLAYYFTYFHSIHSGLTYSKENFVRVRMPEVFVRSFTKAALAFDFKPDAFFEAYFESIGFFQALKDCFPNDKYQNSEKLRASFIIALMHEDIAGKLWAGVFHVASFKGISAAMVLLKKLSVKAYYLVLSGMTYSLGKILVNTYSNKKNQIEQEKIQDAEFLKTYAPGIVDKTNDEIRQIAVENYIDLIPEPTKEPFDLSLTAPGIRLNERIRFYEQKLLVARQMGNKEEFDFLLPKLDRLYSARR